MFVFEFPDERTRQLIAHHLSTYMESLRGNRCVDFIVRDITGTSYPIDYTRLEFEITYFPMTPLWDCRVLHIGMQSDNNKTKGPMGIKFHIEKHKMKTW
jgi:hypothetical protein